MDETTETIALAPEIKKINKSKRLMLTVIKALISAVLIYWILSGTNFKEIFISMSSANFILIILAFSLHFIGFYISAARWRLLLKAQGVNARISFLIKSYLVSSFFNNLLPSTVGGDTVRGYDSYKAGASKPGAVAVIFVDRFLGLFVLMIFALAAVSFAVKITAQSPLLFLWVSLAFLLMTLIVWIIFFPSKKLLDLVDKIRVPFSAKLQRILEKTIEAFWIFKGQKIVLFKALGLSFLLQVIIIFYYFLISSALNFPVSYYNFFLIVPLSIFIMMLPISINGIGLRENIFFFFLSAFAVTKAESIAFAWIEYGMVIMLGLIGGIMYMIRK